MSYSSPPSDLIDIERAHRYRPLMSSGGRMFAEKPKPTVARSTAPSPTPASKAPAPGASYAAFALRSGSPATPDRAARNDSFGRRFNYDFSKIPISPPGGPPLQRKARVTIGSPADPLEREADQVADAVVRGGNNVSVHGSASGAPAQRACAECRKDEETEGAPTLQRKALGAPCVEGVGVESDLARVRATAGAPLPAATRTFMEQRFAHDFSSVRVHTDSAAAQAAAALQARAFTIGRDVVFAASEYAPTTMEGRRLLAHELTHVVQQRGAVGEAGARGAGFTHVQRKECSATRECSPPDRCAQPDPGEEGAATPSTWWMLTVNVDIERGSFEDALRAGRVGHTNVRFSESNGRQYSYGFYPADAIPNENAYSVEGCVNHADTSHDACVDTSVPFPLTKAQYDAALAYAQSVCRTRRYYGVAGGRSYTCTTFAAEVAHAAGMSLPPMASEPTTVYMQAVPAIDNPNTLNENLRAQHHGIGNDEIDILTNVELGGPRMLERFPWQEKARWITILLDETWISDRDVAAIERTCRVGTSAADLAKIQHAVSPLLDQMNSSSQRRRVENALAGR